jgi:hypothetical protein
MKLTLQLFLSLSLSLTPLFVSAQPTEGIEYSPTGIFHWGMFRGKINPDHIREMGENTGAVTVSSLSYKMVDVKGKHVQLKVCAQFHPHESWTRYPHLYHPDEALEHEKRHFDICEIYARKFRQLLANSQWSNRTFDNNLRASFKKLVAEYRAAQARYDRETHHSIDVAQQENWNAKIDRELEELSQYAESVVTIKLN